MASLLTCFVWLSLLLVGLTSAQLWHNDDKHNVDRLVNEVMRCANIPALSLAYVSADRVAREARGYGAVDKTNRVRTERNHIFCIGGATQAFTAVLLSKLIDINDTISWDTPIQDILHRRVALPSKYISYNINLKDILAMRTGLSGMDIVPVAKPYSREKLSRNLRYVPRVAGFRDKFVYNEVLFSLLENVVEEIGGDTWSNLIKRHILEPLKMSQTTIVDERLFSNQNFVKGIVQWRNQPYFLEDSSVYSGLELVASAASLCTTAEDMTLWLDFLLKGGKSGQYTLVGKEALEATYAAVQTRGQGDSFLQGYYQPSQRISYSRSFNSIGWINGFHQGHPFISQDGSIPGFQSLTTVIPSKNIGVYVTFNGDPDEKRFAAKVLINAIVLDNLLQINTWTTSNVCSVLDNLSRSTVKSRKEDKYLNINTGPHPRPLEDYTGMFSNYAFGEVHVRFNASQDNALTLEYGLAVYKLLPFNNNTFQMHVIKGGLSYSTNADYYSVKHRIFAEFSFNVNDPEQRVHSVAIDGFDKNHIPEFSINPGAPYYEDDLDYHRCSASALVPYQYLAVLFCALAFFR